MATLPDPVVGHDEVDRIVAAWGRERPDLDVAPIGVFSRVSRLARLLDLARRTSFGVSELDTWEFDVLSALRRSGSPYRLSPGALITQTLVTSGTMTNRIDRLAERGLVRRLPTPGDRRGVLVELTVPGLEAVDSAMAALLDTERELLLAFPSSDRECLAGLLRALLVRVEGQPSEAAAGPDVY